MEQHIMRTRHLMAVGLVGALALGTAVPASAGPLPIGNSALTTAAAPATTEIRWRGRGGGIGPGLAFGLATGALVGAAVAGGPYGYYGYGGYGYGPGYVYDAPVYAEPYAYAPVYPGYYGGGYGYRGYGYSTCTTDEGYGRRRACDAQ
jgi:hypothetical protein